MRNAIIIDLFREIKKSFGRFVSILGIVLVGVAFFTGVKASAPYMKASADAYFDRTNFLDIKVYSLSGINEQDLETLAGIDGVQNVMGAYRVDVSSTIDTVEHVFEVFGMGDNSVNQITVTEGRLPQHEGECVLRDYSMKSSKLQIGDTLTLDSPMLKDQEFTIVGYVSTPYYLSYQYDSTTVGSGTIDNIAYVVDDEFAMPVYNLAYVTVDGAAEKNCYSDSYFDIVEPVKNRITDEGYIAYDRNYHFSYVDYGNCADRMEAIAKVFPVFFYLVAALVCLTTMTRMVDEQRGNMGTMKALGYSKAKIAFKYVMYAFLAATVGGVIGCVIGLKIFPTVIFNAWNIVYTVEKLVKASQLVPCILAVAVAVLVTEAATIIACISELNEVPANLLRPKAPKSGKKVFLERIGFIWNHFSFMRKVAARNILRYKKRFFMTVIGIAGCTALILAGFGIKNSVSTVVSGQYGKIFAYDLEGTFGDGIDRVTFEKWCEENEDIQSECIYSSYSVVVGNDKTKDAKLLAAQNVTEFAKFTHLFKHSDDKEIVIPEDGALITYKMAKELGLTKGDTFTIEIAGDKYEMQVSDIVTMYVRQYVFVNAEYLSKITGKQSAENSFAIYLNNGVNDDSVGKKIIEEFPIDGIAYYSGIQENFSDMISSLDLITVVLIVSAALLAFVVLYNLINVNVSERIREIATIKVLGFYANEVATYVYRENIILSIIGALVGLGLGVGLHAYIMTVIEMDDVIFPKVIAVPSFFIAFGITLVFCILVNLFMYKKLDKIPMVESLKSVE